MFCIFFYFQRPCVCPHEGCEKSFVRAVHLKRHLLSHDGEKIFKSVLLFTIQYATCKNIQVS